VSSLAFTACASAVRQAGGLAGSEPGEVRRVLEILHLDAVLAFYPRLDVALPRQ
jgi:hypothetical protein